MSRIDIMIPCYNYARFLRDCVASVLSQYHRDLRVLIVDDASTDDTPAVCAELAAQDQRVGVLRHNVNRGHIATYNECIDLAQSDYMLILSADDFLMPRALGTALAVLDGLPDAGMVCGGWVNYSAGDPLPPPTTGQARVALLQPHWFIERLAVANFVATATAIVRTSVQKRLGHYRPDLPHAGDLEMWLRFALHSKVAYIEALLGVYRRHDGNMSKAYDPAADLRQCAAAFELHIPDIRRLVPDGATLEAKIRHHLAAREQIAARQAAMPS
jgi:glycosyltransferase involved in cell wall biosynthesis